MSTELDVDHQQFRRRRFLDRRSDEVGDPRSDIWYRGIKHLRRMKIATAEERVAPPGAPAPTVSAGISWVQIGPQPVRIDHEQIYQGSGPVSGEVTDIEINPEGTEDKVIYITTNNGGVWKSINGGATWAPKTDLMPTLSMGSIALDPVDHQIVYAGTGNNFDGGREFTKGVGIYRSIDAGETWSQLGEAFFTLKRIIQIVLPATNILLVATNDGLFRSIDGGQSFGSNFPNFNDGNPVLAGDINDLALDKGNPSTVYASVEGVGIFVSSDGGVTFPTNLFNNSGAPSAPFNRITFAQSVNPDSNTIYALVTDMTSTPRFKGLYRSTDKGLNWTLMPGAGGPAAENKGLQADYDLVIGVDPQDPNRVYIGFQELYLSTDGGLNFGTPATSQNKIHWDQHVIFFSPHGPGTAPTPFYTGNDGGISRSDDGGANFPNLSETISTNLFLQIDIGRNSTHNNQFTYGGTQDTGTLGHRAEFPANDWHLGVDGDGGPVAVDTNNPLRVYGRDNGQLITTTDGGANWTFPTAAATGLPADGAGNSLGTPRGVDLNSSAIVYVSQGNRLFRSTDTGATFTLMHTFPADIKSFANVKMDSKVLMVGCQDGSLHRTSNADTGAASVWAALTVADAPPNAVGAIAIDPTDTQIAAVGFTGFTGIDPANRTKHVFKTIDAGANFTDVSGTDGGNPDDNFPDLPVHSIVLDPTTTTHSLIVATDSGVVRSIDDGATWQIYGIGLPNTDCTSLAVDHSVSPPLIRLGTYGRSSFELQRLSGPRIGVHSNLAFGNVTQGSNIDLPIDIFNAGDSLLTITDISDPSFNPNFSLQSAPAMPLDMPPGGQSTVTVRFAPTVPGKQIIMYSISSNSISDPVLGISASGFAPITGPQVTGLLPSNGAAAGGSSVKIFGSDLSGATAVMFGGTAATGFTVDSDSQISAVSPAGTGVVDVTVVTPGGTTAANPASRFTYVGGGGSVVTGLDPNQGPETGGTPVRITGSGFVGMTQVLFGGFAASGFTVDSDSQISAVSPAGTGVVDVLVANPSGTSQISNADKYTYTAPGGGLGTGTTGTGTTTGTGVSGAGDAENEVLRALADILRTGTDPEILEAQRILLRRIALEGNIIDSRIPPPKNITEIGGYINLLGNLGHLDIRTQMLASALGVAGPATPIGLSSEAPILAFISMPNDRPEGSGKATYLINITVRSDMADSLAQAVQRIHGLGCALPLFTPPRTLPRHFPGIKTEPDYLLLLGRVLEIAPSAILRDPATDPLAIARRESESIDKVQLVAREIDGEARIGTASWIALRANETSVTEEPPALRQYIPIASILADAGWYPVSPLASVDFRSSLVRFTNVSGLIAGKTKLGEELSLLYPQSVIMSSSLADRVSWIWNGTSFVPPA